MFSMELEGKIGKGFSDLIREEKRRARLAEAAREELEAKIERIKAEVEAENRRREYANLAVKVLLANLLPPESKRVNSCKLPLITPYTFSTDEKLELQINIDNNYWPAGKYPIDTVLRLVASNSSGVFASMDVCYLSKPQLVTDVNTTPSRGLPWMHGVMPMNDNVQDIGNEEFEFICQMLAEAAQLAGIDLSDLEYPF